MEGPCLRRFPRTVLDNPIELCLAEKSIRIERATGNVSARGLFVKGPEVPPGTALGIRIAAGGLVEAEGVIRRSEPHGAGVGIEFTRFHDGHREPLDQLIEELTRRGLPAS